MFRSIFFDLDGTLTDPALGITNAIIYARKKFGLEPGKNQDYYKFIGPPMPDSFMEYFGLSRPEGERMLSYYREYFSELGLFENRVYPGIPELLSDLKAAGCRLFIATTKPTVFSLRIAERFGLSPYFEMVSGSEMQGDNSKTRVIRNARDACHVDMTSAVMVGDRFHDVEGAKNTGIPCIGVTYGFGGREELETAGADFLADTVEELREILLPD